MIIGYTTGVFDLFHIGHLNIIKNAKSKCDKLIVGVTTDELCHQRKGVYPMICFEERLQIVSNIVGVDEVVKQDTMNKITAWKKHSFNRIFVGDDWKGTEKWNQLEIQFSELGVEIVYFPYTKSTSSTQLRKLINEINKKTTTI